LVAATTRTSTLRAWVPPTRSISRSAARAALACAVQRQVADLVEEQGAAIGPLEAAGPVASAPV
jgi:hypothetical protein